MASVPKKIQKADICPLKMKDALFTYFVLFVVFGLAQGRVVRVSEGPLVRVEGQVVSLRCDVSDYEGPSEQDFDWKVLRGDQWVQLISTFDLGFADRSMQGRVDTGDISVERLGPAAAELRIRGLTPADSATYRCSTPSTDSVIKGNYKADVQLTVIGDSLKVVPSTPPAMVPEGGPLQLRCNATRDVLNHAYTHLSLTWSVGSGAGAEDILTFGPDGEVRVGGGTSQRYEDGGIRLDLRGGGAYGLVLTQALPGDGGMYTCTAREWSREVGGAWQQILERSVEMGEVRVTPTAESLAVSVEEANATLSVDDTLNLTCSAAADDRPALGLEVTWLLNPAPGGDPAEPRVVAHMSRDGVAEGASEAVGVARVGAGSFRLLVRGVGQDDTGLYSCRVRAWIHRSGGDWYQAAEKTSDPVQVLVTLKDPDFRVTLLDGVTPQFSGDPTELRCQVTGVSGLGGGRLGVSWLYAEAVPGDVTGGGASITIAGLDAQGNLRAAEGYRDRVENGLLVLSRTEPDSFRLRLLRTLDTDMGAYSCAVSAWSPARSGGWERGKEVRSQPLNVFWIPKSPRVSVAARRLREATSAGATFEMSCQLTAQNLQDPGYSVVIQMEESLGGQTRKVLSLSADSVLGLEEWSELDRMVLEKTGHKEFRFRLYRAQASDRGFYYCAVTAWTRDPSPGNAWTKATSTESNKVHITFADTGPVFNVSVRSDTSSVSPWETAKMQCVVAVLGASPGPDDVSYEVRWYLNRGLDSATLLATVDRWGVVRKGLRNGSSDCSVERVDARTYVLSTHNTQDSDAGQYYCTATPWTRSPTGAWTRGRDLTSARIHLTVNFALWDSMQRPLLFGAGVALAVGLLSILLGLVCTRCCCRKALQTPRPQHPLTDMEME
ncbi:hypothetical protein AAFF_G00279910 [Aldrovandia affinis]|uniref:Ig-like domain-containing protein n=1 Tax=Aldrovandia affinis TaxID=143900 RepID=A0AAD7SRB9_9TELE|nr:hypothetical protein AAFF_G00279910 [Aldrovandia affinis]